MWFTPQRYENYSIIILEAIGKSINPETFILCTPSYPNSCGKSFHIDDELSKKQDCLETELPWAAGLTHQASTMT